MYTKLIIIFLLLFQNWSKGILLSTASDSSNRQVPSLSLSLSLSQFVLSVGSRVSLL